MATTLIRRPLALHETESIVVVGSRRSDGSSGYSERVCLFRGIASSRTTRQRVEWSKRRRSIVPPAPLFSVRTTNIQTQSLTSISTRDCRGEESSRAKVCPLTETPSTTENDGSWVHLSPTATRARNTKSEVYIRHVRRRVNRATSQEAKFSSSAREWRALPLGRNASNSHPAALPGNFRM